MAQKKKSKTPIIDAIDLDAELGKDEHRAAMEKWDWLLAEQQRAAREARVPVIVVFEGWDAAGKGSSISRLVHPLDPRGFKVHAMSSPTRDEEGKPPLWRFWTRLPARGWIAIFERSWYRRVLEERVEGRFTKKAVGGAYEQIRVFERQLTEDGAVIVKFFLHISKQEQAKRFKQIRKQPEYAWRVGKAELRQNRQYAEHKQAIEDMLEATSAPHAPWTVVPATDRRYVEETVARTLFETVASALQAKKASAEKPEQAPEPAAKPSRAHVGPLDTADLSLSLSRDEYKKVLPELQDEARRLQFRCYEAKLPVVIVYEGWDAAGKGGNIRRLAAELDPRGYEVVPVAAPEGDERTHHYLWRFWRALPRAGHLTIFDRSWYGRVMVERVEGFAAEEDWLRAYNEINEFEAQIVDCGCVLIKFWLHISKSEQLRRFRSREQTPEKLWKITAEDWRNREKWEAYWEAVSEMIERTSTPKTPWTIVEANDKLHARVKALRVLVDRVDKSLRGI